MSDLRELSTAELLDLDSRFMEELRERGVLRSSNNPTGDVAEYLCCTAFGWALAPNSEKHFDATGQDGIKFQIKARRVTRHSNSRQLGALRDLDKIGFDHLAGVLFNENYTVLRAAIIPHQQILNGSKFVARTNSWRFFLRDEVWRWPGVKDVTEILKGFEI